MMKSLFATGKKIVVITDSKRDIEMIRDFGNIITKQSWKKVETMADFFYMQSALDGYFYLPSSLLESLWDPAYLRRVHVFEIRRGMTISPESCIEKLISLGYAHTQSIDGLGTYKRDGSIIHIWDPWSEDIWSIEWFDTEIDSIVEMKKNGEKRNFRENIEIKSLSRNKEEERTIGVLNEPLWNMITGTLCVIGCDFLPYIDTLRGRPEVIHLTDFHREWAMSLDVSIPGITHIDALREYIQWRWAPAKICIYTRYDRSVREFLEYNSLSNVEIMAMTRWGLESFDAGRMPEREKSGEGKMPQKQEVQWKKILSTGAHSDVSDWEIHFFEEEIRHFWGISVITDDIIAEIFVRTRTRKSLAKNLDLLIALKSWDYVVHREHGIAKFVWVIEKTLSGIRREYIELHYAWADKLFVPLTEIYRVSKYIWENNPELTNLSGKEWERTLEKTDEELEKIATELIELSAKRTLAKGIAFGSFPDEEEKFRQAFTYEHTLDQKTCIDEISQDMESEYPMDRLLSGDVGFGKTEVAMNAIYKAILSGYQVAVISPLLVLADEHYETFCERFADFWVKVGVLTRMSSREEISATLEDMKSGTIDLVVGTHRLLSSDIRWKRLGLLVIDEEHKFGVAHKETIKKIRANVDILSLSATPIPRSLNLALSGLKKISLLTTPPKKKQPIETIVTAWNESTLRHAIDYEYERGGQVIIIANRIIGIESVRQEIESIIGKKVRIITTHGKMPGDMIEERIHAFKKWEYDILLSTTIIENGVNFLRANTIIILDPEDFWLAQLHQLRGRVGRKWEQGYCYLMYRKWELPADARERIVTIANNSHLGAGFEIAMRDMEIRGAWDVLGFKQAGKSKDIGLSLYFRMLEEKIEEIKNERKTRLPVKIELELSYSLPEDLFLSETDKLNFFREIENIESREELDEIESTLKKGKDWESGISNLFLLLRGRLILREYGVIGVKKIGVSYVFDFLEGTSVEKIRAFLGRFDPKNRMILLSVKKIKVDTSYWKSAIEFLRELTE